MRIARLYLHPAGYTRIGMNYTVYLHARWLLPHAHGNLRCIFYLYLHPITTPMYLGPTLSRYRGQEALSTDTYTCTSHSYLHT